VTGRTLLGAITGAVLLAAASPTAGVAAPSSFKGSTTVFVLDVSGSMEYAARIPADFPKAEKLKKRQDEFASLVEQVSSKKKVPLKVIVAGVSGIQELIQLNQELEDFLKKKGVDPKSISKLAVLRVATATMLALLQAERDNLGLDNKAGIVTFSDDAATVAPVTPDMAGLKVAVAGLETAGSTNLGSGLQMALGMLQGAPNPSIVLMTDGWNNTGMTNDEILSGPVQEATKRQIPICSIGIGQSRSDVDQVLLEQISTRTGAPLRFVDDGVSLGADMIACHHALTGQLLNDARGTVKQGETRKLPGVTLPAGKQRAVFSLTWPGSDLDLQLIDPGGRPVGAGYPGASVTRAPGLVMMTIANPPAGAYQTAVVGKQTAAGGEFFSVAAATDGTTPVMPRDRAVAREAPGDDVQRTLRIVEIVSAVLLVLLVLLLLIRWVRRLAGRGRTAAAPQVPPAQPGMAAQAPATAPAAQTRGTGCATCLIWMVMVVDALVLAGAIGALWLWETPLLGLPA
jgi:uncharacterized protein YegL